VIDPTVQNLTIFVLAVLVGYHVVWNVTPALHTPLMSVTNAISGIIIAGALLQTVDIDGPITLTSVLGAIAVMLASINIFGGFLVTQRMLEMFRKKEPKLKDAKLAAPSAAASASAAETKLAKPVASKH